MLENKNVVDLINEKVAMLNAEFGLEQIREDVIRHVFRNGIGIIRIDTMIHTSMEIYAEIIHRWKKENGG